MSSERRYHDNLQMVPAGLGCINWTIRRFRHVSRIMQGACTRTALAKYTTRHSVIKGKSSKKGFDYLSSWRINSSGDDGCILVEQHELYVRNHPSPHPQILKTEKSYLAASTKTITRFDLECLPHRLMVPSLASFRRLKSRQELLLPFDISRKGTEEGFSMDRGQFLKILFFQSRGSASTEVYAATTADIYVD